MLLLSVQTQTICAFCGFWLKTTTQRFQCGQSICTSQLCKFCVTEIVCPLHNGSGVTKKDQKKGDDRGSVPVVQFQL